MAPRIQAAVFAAVGVLYAVGVVGHVLAPTLPWMLVLTPWFLVLSGTVVFLVSVWGSDLRSLVLWFFPVLVVTLGLEAAGVATGAVFGPYHYTTILGTLVLGVPPVIGLNWVLVVLGAHGAVRRLMPRWPEVARIAATGLLCVGFDLLLEPVAISLGYWVWEGGQVPLQNYLAWGLIAAAGSWWAGRFRALADGGILGWYALLQAAFFLALGLLGVHA